VGAEDDNMVNNLGMETDMSMGSKTTVVQDLHLVKSLNSKLVSVAGAM